MRLFRVVKPGFYTTVQDVGRHDFLKYGVPISGAMDEFSLQLANMVVGNNPNDACLEITLIGPELEALGDTQIAMTGGDVAPKINGQDVEMWQTLRVEKGDLIVLGKARTGCRAYLSIRGGINVPLVLGSRSTYVRCEIGGKGGRQLRAGDVIEGFDSIKPLDFKLPLPDDFIPRFEDEAHVRVMLGPQLENFAKRGVETFLSNPYRITIEADRMGYRLEGPSIGHKEHNEAISDAILPGAVQVPPNCQPIVMMKDAQTTGGYLKIAVVITSDLYILGQAKPNDSVYFHRTTLNEACRRLAEYKKRFQIIKRKLPRQRLDD